MHVPSTAFVPPLPLRARPLPPLSLSQLTRSSTSQPARRHIAVAHLHTSHQSNQPEPIPHHKPSNSNLFRVNPDLLESDPEENLRGFVKTRGSLIPGEQFVFWWVGDIYDFIDEKPSKHLFSFEGYNIGRMIRVDGGWRMLTREVGIYKHPRTGKILDVWENPYTRLTNKCVHVWNDPVNQQFLLNGARGPFRVPTTTFEDDIYWHAEVFLNYKSPLQRSDFPDNAASDIYQSAEMFQFFSKRDQLLADKPSADCAISWVRVGQWLPWMEMGNHPGHLIYHCRGRKLSGAFSSLPQHVQRYIMSTKPEYSEAPTNFTTPNETSWTYMKKLLAQRGAPRADGRAAHPEPVDISAGPNTKSNLKNAQEMQLPATMNRKQLVAFNGTKPTAPMLLAVDGKIFDVSSAKRHYGAGETYHCLLGHDASWALVSGDLSENALREDNVRTLRERLDHNQISDLEQWVAFFEKNYPQVSRLVE